MGKAGKWMKNLLIGRKDKDKRLGGGEANGEPFETPRTPHPAIPKEKKRWSFRKSSKDFSSNPMDFSIPPSTQAILESENEQKKHALIVAAATAAAADAAVAAAHAAATVINLTAAATSRKQKVIEEAAAIKIQAVYRSHLARKALRALKGLVKLQALARGHLVRKQAATTLRCMQALVTVQARARAQRIQMVGESQPHTQILSSSIQRKSSKVNGFKQNYDINRSLDENIKVVEMYNGETGGSTKRRNIDSLNYQCQMSPAYSKHDYHYHMSPAASTLTDISPRLCSEYFLAAQQLESDKMSQNGEICPNYMANTESFRAKARSQSAPKQRTDLFERQSSSRRKASIVPRAIRMQRSSSHVESTNNGYQSP